MSMGMKLVLVDDESEILTLVRDYLSREGFSVLTAMNGTDGMQLIERERPDLVLLDWMLPGMSGLEMCRRLRETSAIPIIMLTAKSEEIDRVLGLEFGADDYIVKPLSLIHISEPTRLGMISYAVFCLKKKKLKKLITLLISL